MPTGLTGGIYDGNTSLRAFALRCVTQIGYGYAATEGGNKELPLDKAPVLEVGQYYYDNLKKAEENLAYLESIKDDETALRAIYNKEMEEIRAGEEELDKSTAELREKYTSMLNKIDEWDLPQEYQSLRGLMMEQIQKSMKWDCPDGRSYCGLQRVSFKEWLKMKMEQANEDVMYHRNRLEEAEKRVSNVNKYMNGLYAELDKIEPLK